MRAEIAIEAKAKKRRRKTGKIAVKLEEDDGVEMEYHRKRKESPPLAKRLK